MIQAQAIASIIYPKILVTGGAGYIGSHTLIELIQAGFVPVVYDNLSNSSFVAVQRVEQIVGKHIEFIQGDVLDKTHLDAVLRHISFCCSSFCRAKSCGRKHQNPLKYYQNNVVGTLSLLELMAKYGVKILRFFIIGNRLWQLKSPTNHRGYATFCTSPYGQSKLMVEHILEDLVNADDTWNVVCLRYF